jgi:hypothetical protein
MERRLDPGAGAVVVAVWAWDHVTPQYNNKPENVVLYRIPAEMDVMETRR